MPKKLLIVESPAKARTINRILGADFSVMASMGHVRDLPEKRLGIDLRDNFKPEYVEVEGRGKILRDLRKSAARCEQVFLAPDPDREGESIAWHLREALGTLDPAPEFLRVTYNEITPAAVRRAVANPGRIDSRRVDAQQARRVLDRLVGYKVSPLLWRQVERGLSAGRVQSVALRLVCEREALIRDFQAREYWLIGARVSKREPPEDPFEMRLLRVGREKANVPDAASAAALLEDADADSLRVAKLSVRKSTRRPPPPHITSTLQQACSSVYGFSPARTMRIAQSLYEGVDLGNGPAGLITYMRTDSFAVSADAREQARAWIESRFGSDYLPAKPNVYANRGGAQAAHEAIRPTDARRTPEDLRAHLNADQFKVYTAVWQRFMASQMAPARILQRWADIDAASRRQGPGHYLFRAAVSEIEFPGYMRVTGADRPAAGAAKSEEGINEALPPLSEGEPLRCLEWLKERKETQPPPRFSEASLVRELEKNGVGRPSTYAQILKTLTDRRYVNRERKTLSPTDLGIRVNDFLTAHLAELFDVGFTAAMEGALDRIEEGALKWTDMLADFWRRFSEWLEQAREPPADKHKTGELLDLMNGITEWREKRKIGRRVYDDRAFVESLRKQVAGGGNLSPRQLNALARLAARYVDQEPKLKEAIGDMEGGAEMMETPSSPRESTLRKLDLLRGLDLDPPAQRGKRVYDDRAFLESLGERVAGGRALSDNQLRALDRIVLKYRGRIPDFESLRAELDLPDGIAESGADPEAVRALLARLAEVREWAPPRAGRSGGANRRRDDRAFYDSLREQFERNGSLTARQYAALDRMAKRYARTAETTGVAGGEDA